MTLEAVVDEVRGREKTLTVYADEESDIVDDVQAHFAAQNLAVEAVDADGRPEHAVLSDDGEVLTAVGVDALRALTDGPRNIGEDVPYEPLLEHLDRATFTSNSRRQMLEASREIEDRAWRAGSGTLHAGFQKLSTFEHERDTYRRLAERDLDVHVYASRDVSIRTPTDVDVHAAPELAKWWFVIYDGDAQQSTALVAEERDDGFYGVWTYDVDLVETALDAIRPRQSPA
jgi:DICT domain-containing protein